MDNLWAFREHYDYLKSTKPKDGNDLDYFKWLETVDDTQVIVEELLDHWSFFQGDSYYRDFQNIFEKKLKEIFGIEDSNIRT